MNVMTAIGPVAPDAHARAQISVDLWRGACVRHFATLEQAIAKFLAVNDSDTTSLSHGLGGRIKQLEKHLEASGLPSPALRKKLRDFEPFKQQRSGIVHGVGPVYLNEDGAWLWDAAFSETEGKDFRTEIFRKADAEAFECKLKVSVERLCQSIGDIKVSKPTKVEPGKVVTE